MQDSSFARQPRFASVATSILVHTAIVGLLLLVSGPVWKSAPRRTVTRLVLPSQIAAATPVLTKLPRRQLSKTPLPSVATPVAAPVGAPAAPQKPWSPPVRTATQPAFRIELPPMMAPLTMPALPAVSMSALAVRPAVQVGLLSSPAAVAATSARTAGALGSFDAGPADGGARSRVAGSGFDEPSSGRPAPSRRRLSNGGFDQAETPASQSPVARVVSTPFEGIEILEKPRPVYTDEARRLRIEGTVQLRVVFGAAGQIRVVSVEKGLGHGLDEAAVQAAEAIRFRPARRDGHPVDAPAVIQIQFQIA